MQSDWTVCLAPTLHLLQDYNPKKHPLKAHCWKNGKGVRLNTKSSNTLTDVSVPTRKIKSATLDLTVVGAKPSSSDEWIDVGSISYTGKKGTRTKKLVCHKDSGCVYDVPKSPHSRMIYKLNGGALKEVADGQAWVESNSDGGSWQFFFGTVLSTPEFVLVLDPSRDIWLKIKPPPALPGEPFVNSRVFIGQVGKGKNRKKNFFLKKTNK